jgi:hypothetical protein
MARASEKARATMLIVLSEDPAEKADGKIDNYEHEPS